MLLGNHRRGPGKGKDDFRVKAVSRVLRASWMRRLTMVENGLRFRRIANGLIDNKNQLERTLCSCIGQRMVLMYVFPSTG
jgi:hypothetical protein